MTTRRIEFTGVDARSGRRLSPPTSLEEIGRRAIAATQLDEKTLRLIADLLAGTAAHDPKRAPSADVTDPADLAQTGWAVLFAPGTPREVEVALEPLIKLRRAQAKDRFKLYQGIAAETMYELFQGIDHPPGDVPDPEKLPYYVLLVGDPERIPYRLQVQLDIRYAVGRLHFASVDEYAHYAAAVVASEMKTRPPRPRELSFFAASHPGDRATESVAAELVAPLADALTRQRGDWRVHAVTGAKAQRSALESLVAHMPTLLFAAGHGVRYDDGDEDQLARQGALVCSDWPGGESPLEAEQMFA